jgi:cytochrome o ubiquinol oxidase subunit 1
VFGVFAGVQFWFPKAFGYKLDEFWGKCAFWFWVIGFYLAFMPLYVLGLMGVTRQKLRFAIREGGRTVGAGVVASIIE